MEINRQIDGWDANLMGWIEVDSDSPNQTKIDMYKDSNILKYI